MEICGGWAHCPSSSGEKSPFAPQDSHRLRSDGHQRALGPVSFSAILDPCWNLCPQTLGALSLLLSFPPHPSLSFCIAVQAEVTTGDHLVPLYCPKPPLPHLCPRDLHLSSLPTAPLPPPCHFLFGWHGADGPGATTERGVEGI